jgi:hypothetical protein
MASVRLQEFYCLLQSVTFAIALSVTSGRLEGFYRILQSVLFIFGQNMVSVRLPEFCVLQRISLIFALRMALVWVCFGICRLSVQ